MIIKNHSLLLVLFFLLSSTAQAWYPGFPYYPHYPYYPDNYYGSCNRASAETAVQGLPNCGVMPFYQGEYASMGYLTGFLIGADYWIGSWYYNNYYYHRYVWNDYWPSGDVHKENGMTWGRWNPDNWQYNKNWNKL